MPYTRLAQNLTDQITEEQAKLGFDEKEIRLYYPLSSLCHITETKTDIAGMESLLQGFAGAVQSTLGPVSCTRNDDRFCFHIPPEGVRWVRDHTPEDTFIRKLVSLIVTPGISMAEIEALFREHGQITVKPMDSDEFDTLIYFRQGPDRYYYCFQDDGFDIRYHRFLPGDYFDFGY